MARLIIFEMFKNWSFLEKMPNSVSNFGNFPVYFVRFYQVFRLQERIAGRLILDIASGSPRVCILTEYISVKRDIFKDPFYLFSNALKTT